MVLGGLKDDASLSTGMLLARAVFVCLPEMDGRVSHKPYSSARTWVPMLVARPADFGVKPAMWRMPRLTMPSKAMNIVMEMVA